MLLFDVLVRYPAVTMLFISAFFCVRDGRKITQARLGGLLSISIACLLLGTAPEALKLPAPLYYVVRILDIPNLALLWLFARSLFVDDFRMARLEWSGLAFYVAIVAILRLNDLNILAYVPPIIGHFATFLSALLAGHIIWTALSGRQDDLVESRRQGRPWFSIFLALAASVTIFAEIFWPYDHPVLSLVRAGVTLPMAAWGLVWLLNFQSEKLLFQPVETKAPKAPAIAPKDLDLLQRLNSVMDAEEFYKEQGLTIRTLAEKLRAPEHQLRALINQGLGYRNFAAYLNHYRIAYAKEILSSVEQARLPVLTIAMDAGYNSLAPFNRAFKSMEGVTPTAYRTQALSAAASAS